MGKRFLSIAFILVSVNLIAFKSISYSVHDHSELKIIFIRHGEKPENGNHLSCKGLNRALQLPAVIESKFGIPDYIYTPSLKLAEKTKQARMYETAVPMAVKYNIDINNAYDETDSTGVADDILRRKGTVLVVWEHKAINSILHSLGVYNTTKWESADFNTIIIVDYHKGQAVMTKDTEGLNPSDVCP